jgi:hypothetical protein
MRDILEALGWTERIILRLMLYLIAAGTFLTFFVGGDPSAHYASGIGFVIALGMLAVTSSGNWPLMK